VTLAVCVFPFDCDCEYVFPNSIASFVVGHLFPKTIYMYTHTQILSLTSAPPAPPPPTISLARCLSFSSLARAPSNRLAGVSDCITRCNTLLHTATHCNTHFAPAWLHLSLHHTLQNAAIHCSTHFAPACLRLSLHHMLQHTATHTSLLRARISHCNTHCNSHCNLLQHIFCSRVSHCIRARVCIVSCAIADMLRRARTYTARTYTFTIEHLRTYIHT